MTQRQTLSLLKEYPEIMTVSEAANVLRIGKNKTYDLVKAGKLNSMKLGGKIIIPKMCLVSFILDTKNYQFEPQIISENLWTMGKICGIMCSANDTAKSVDVN